MYKRTKAGVTKGIIKTTFPLSLIPIIFFMDFFVKQYIERYGEETEGEKLLWNCIKLTKHHNKGMAMNLCSDHREWVLAVSSLFVAGLWFRLVVAFSKKGNKLEKYGLCFLIGGAASNLYDRYVRHYVVDYFTFQTGISQIDRIIFNLSDLCILLGIMLTGVDWRENELYY